MNEKELYQEAIKAFDNKEIQKAYELFTKCVELNPNIPAYRLRLAQSACALARPADSLREIAYFHAMESARLAPDILENWLALGEVSLEACKYNESINAYKKAVSIHPQHAKAWGLMGFAYAKLSKNKEAKNCYEKAVELDSENGDFHFLLSCQLADEEHNSEKKAYHGEMGFKAKKPAVLSVESCWNAAHGYLDIGDYEKGWNYFEARLRRNITNFGNVLPQDRFKQPLWTRQKNCTVLIQNEMGFGDNFMMARYFSIIENMFNIKVIYECMPHMINLIQENFPTIKCIEYGKVDCEFDYHLPIMSLPLICNTTSDNIPWNGAYIRANQNKLEEWRGKLLLCKNKPNIGITWAGGARSHNAHNSEIDKKRSISFNRIKHLLELPINFISLQPELDDIPKVGIKDFSDTASIIHLLDAVIAVDTSVVNLAGAMGKKTYLLNRYDSCYRWSKHLKTPWYPTVENIQQIRYNDWDYVLDKINDELLKLSGKIAA